MLHCPESCRGPGRHADLAVDVLDVVVGDLRRDVEAAGDVLRREALRSQPQHLDLAAREPARVLLSLARALVRTARQMIAMFMPEDDAGAKGNGKHEEGS